MPGTEYEDRDQSGIVPESSSPVFSPYVPFYKDIQRYCNRVSNGPMVVPFEITGWRDEQLSWEKTCYIHGGLNPTPTFRFRGPGAREFLKKHTVNTYEKFPIGSGKHCIQCDEAGDIMGHGVVFRTGEDEFETYWMILLAHAAESEKGNYEMEFTDMTAERFLLQIAGPKSLSVLESATGEDLHNVKFFRFRNTSINEKKLRIARLGMAGTLAYELHGDIRYSREIYDAVYQAGKHFGIRRLGWYAYMMQHTMNGFPQASYHFPIKIPGRDTRGLIRGSVGPEETGYRNPVELGWGFCIKFDHDFIGRPALEKMMADPKRTIVTLEWNEEDIMKVHDSQFGDEEPYAPFDSVNDLASDFAIRVHQDRVLDTEGNQVGVSSGRMYSVYYRRMISISTLDIPLAKIGSEVSVLWGDPGTRQIKIRAKVARFPYFDENRNSTFDVETIPHPG